MATRYDDGLSVRAIYAAEDAVVALIDAGGLVEFHSSTLDLRDCRIARFAPPQVHLMQGIVDGLYQANHSPGLPVRPPTLRISERLHRRAMYCRAPHEIVLPRHGEWAWSMPVLLHETSHSLSGGSHNQRSAHGHQWRKMYASLVSQAIGPEAGLLLMDAFDL